METSSLQWILIKILSSEINETELDNCVKERLTPQIISSLYELAKRHDLAHIVSSYLYKNNLLGDDKLLEKFKKEEMLAVYRYENINYAYNEICEIFNDKQIPYIPLKGSVIRKYYPKESMRTSCDIDILIKEENLDLAINSLTQNGYVCGERDYHDVSLFSPNKIHLELHFNIEENNEKMDVVLKDAWEYAVKVENSRYEFTGEFFLFHILAHTAYHFLFGGCGIRSLIDVYIINNKMGISCEQANDLLEKAGIDKFAKEITNLAEICFSDKEKDDFADTLLTYIFNGGAYGNVANNVAINNNKSHVSAGFIKKRIFVPFRDIANEYPVVKKAPILVVFYWFVRTTKLFFRFIKNIFTRRKARKNISSSAIDASAKIRSRLGL